MSRSKNVSRLRLDTNNSAIFDEDFSRPSLDSDLSAALPDRCNQGPSQGRRTAPAHLGFPRAGKQRRDVMAKAFASEIHFP